jgi:putative N6-adenine-specific DNA methylase
MQETLAAACVLSTGWDGSTPFVLPMCGSGTPAIEAALIARRRAPGLLRDRFTFMALKGYAASADATNTSPKARFLALRVEARKGERAAGLPPIIATDIDPEAVEIAKQNAAAAGVLEDLTFDVCDFAYTQIPAKPGVVFLNPEYGARLGDAATLEPLYGRIGDFFKQRCSGWRGFVFTGNMELSRKIGLRSASRKIFFNGPIECRLVGFEMYEGTRRKEKPGADEATGS